MVTASALLVSRLYQQNWLVEHTLHVIEEGQQALTCLLDCETAARGYMLTRDKRYLEPYEICYQHVAGHLGTLRALTADNPAQQAVMPQLFALADEKIKRSQQLIEMRDTSPVSSQHLASMEPDKLIMDKFRGAIATVLDREQRLLQQRAGEANRLQTYVYISVGILGAMLLVILVGAAIAARREKLARDEAASSQSELRQTRALFDSTVSNVKDYAIFLLDPAGIVRTWNSGAERIKGYLASEIIGKHFSIFYSEESRLDHHPGAELNEALEKGRSEEENWRIRKDGSLFWASVTITPVMDEGGKLSGFIKVTRDLTARKQAEEKLAQYAKELETARDEAIRASALKGQFVANVSHEVRTPLTGIVGLAELLSIDQTLPSRAHDAAVRVFNASQRLLTVLNDILNFSKLEAGRVGTENVPFSVKTVIDELKSLYLPQAQQKGLAFEVHVDKAVPAEVLGDPTKISQSLMNLVSNALKFTARGGIEAAAEVAENKLRFSITDTGIGIPPEAQSGLFTAFTQADAGTTRKYGGTGLGLAIVKQYIVLMGGEVGFITEDGRGSTFWFSVPLQTREESNAQA